MLIIYPTAKRAYGKFSNALTAFFDNKEFSIGREGIGPYTNRERLEQLGYKYIQLDYLCNGIPMDIPVQTSDLRKLMEYYRERFEARTR